MYHKLGVVELGEQLFKSGDLDPIYLGLLGSELPTDQLSRWLVSYFCFYHAGFASLASENRGKKFWKVMMEAAVNETSAPGGGRWPRGSERRHFRGKAAVNTINYLEKRYGTTPEGMIEFLLAGPMDVRSVMNRVKTHHLFGEWISFKAADMIDAVIGIRVDQSDVSVFLYDSPRISIEENIAKGVVPHPDLNAAMGWLQRQLKCCRIPHRLDDSPDWFSLETVWCKHLSHMHGHYPLYKDITEIRHGLVAWLKHSNTAQRFLLTMPDLPSHYRQTGELI